MQDARRWVVETCRDIGRADLVECAELGVSELVTNALLHASPPLTVRVRGTHEHPRVEVRDGSTDLPVIPTRDEQDDDLLLTFGRGLSIVARCSTAWGVAVEDDGKVVWFVPASQSSDQMAVGVVSGEPAPLARVAAPDDVHVDLLGVPLRSFVELQRHHRELRREVRLLALAHQVQYPLATDLADLFGTLDRDLRDGIGSAEVADALRSGAVTADLRVPLPRETALRIGRFIELLDLADDFCREERLLSLARTPEQQQFQRWFLGEFVRQQEGGTPRAWQDAPVARQSSAR